MKTEEFIKFYKEVEQGDFPTLVGCFLTEEQIVAIDILIAKRMRRLIEYQQNAIHTRRQKNYIGELRLQGHNV